MRERVTALNESTEKKRFVVVSRLTKQQQPLRGLTSIFNVSNSHKSIGLSLDFRNSLKARIILLENFFEETFAMFGEGKKYNSVRHFFCRKAIVEGA